MRHILAILLLAGICLNSHGQIPHQILVDVTDATTGVTSSQVYTVECPATNCPPPIICPICPTNNGNTPAPFNLTSVASNTWITLNWQNPTGLATNIVLKSPNTVLAILTHGETSFTDTGLTPSTSYSYAIVGVSADLFGVFKTLTPTNVVPVGLQAPTGLTVTSTAPGSLTLNWTQPGTLSGIWIVTNGTMSSFTATSNGTSYAASESGFKSGAVITNTIYAHDAVGNLKSASVIGVAQ